MIAVIPVRGGILPIGAEEAITEASGRTLLIGEQVSLAARSITVDVESLELAEVGPFRPAAWSKALAGHLTDAIVVFPGSPDGRDLAPRLAAAMGRPHLAGALRVTESSVTVPRFASRVLLDSPLAGSVVVTLQAGLASAARPMEPGTHAPVEVALVLSDIPDPVVLEVEPADPETLDLREAKRLFAGGAGLDGPGRFVTLGDVAGAVGASMGATRVITDRDWVPFRRQIGTTGVTVAPDLYVAFGISGAVQHTAGLGAPEHIISVNHDRSCPMMAMANLAVVADANAVLDELHHLLGGDASA
ncbi:MAG: mycofactocin-associated electron transfer flavoprotein alpha subunit [Actinomycetes bacterium]